MRGRKEWVKNAMGAGEENDILLVEVICQMTVIIELAALIGIPPYVYDIPLVSENSQRCSICVWCGYSSIAI